MALLETEVLASSVSDTSARRAALANWAANLAALRRSQPAAAKELADCEPSDFDDTALEWVFARDGFLTARHAGGGWWSGCSVPAGAAAAMLRKLELTGSVSAFLAPAHAAQISAALNAASPQQCIIALQPDLQALSIDLHCRDFSAEIDAHRLLFAWGMQWVEQLVALLRQYPGLPTPTQFIRTPATPGELTDSMIALAEPAIDAEQHRRLAAIAAVTRNAPHRDADAPFCVVAGSRFRLWDDAGQALIGVMAGNERSHKVLHLDPDDPLRTSALHVATTVAEAGALVTANIPRSALPDVIPSQLPVIIWLTSPRIPAYDAAFGKDGLLLADPAWKTLAQACGWPVDRLQIASWPSAELMTAAPVAVESSRSCGPDEAQNRVEQPGRSASTIQSATTNPQSLAMIADTVALDVPYEKLSLSSHHVLWEMIRAELLSRPLALGSDIEQYLADRRARVRISQEGFDTLLFVTKLILPAYQQGLARSLIREGIAIRLYGKGWDACGEYASGDEVKPDRIDLMPFWGGTVDSRIGLLNIAAASAGLIHCWPGSAAHPIDTLGVPVLRRTTDSLAGLFHDARFILGGGGKAPRPQAAVLSFDLVRRALR